MRSTTVLAALAALVALPPAAAAQRIPEGCVATSPAGPAGNPCTYTAIGDAAYAAHGDWIITIERRGRRLVLDSASAPSAAAGAVRAGDVVTAHARTPGSAVAVTRTAAFGGAGAPACSGGAYGPSGPPGTDPLRGRQWALDVLHVDEAWRGGRGGGVTIAVVDTGVDLGHPDLVERLVPGADLWASRPGAEPDCPGPQDEQGHGTMVAGVVAAGAGNGHGIAGVAPAARVMPVRVRDAVDSLDFSRVAPGIRWAADHGAQIISLTGGVAVPVRPDPVVQEQIAEAAAYAWSRGVVTVATAGNASLPWCQYPAASEHVVCAAASGRDGRPATYSQAPLPLGGGLAVRAPGGSRNGTCADDVLSTTVPGTLGGGCASAGYATDSGTTYATAHTAGIAALLAGRRLDNAAIVECLRASATGAVTPLDGAGAIDALRAVACAQRRGATG
jgi:subtilisin family serine protease